MFRRNVRGYCFDSRLREEPPTGRLHWRRLFHRRAFNHFARCNHRRSLYCRSGEHGRSKCACRIARGREPRTCDRDQCQNDALWSSLRKRHQGRGVMPSSPALIARGSASALEYQIVLAHDLKLISSDSYEQLALTEIKRMLTVLVQKLTAES